MQYFFSERILKNLYFCGKSFEYGPDYKMIWHYSQQIGVFMMKSKKNFFHSPSKLPNFCRVLFSKYHRKILCEPQNQEKNCAQSCENLALTLLETPCTLNGAFLYFFNKIQFQPVWSTWGFWKSVCWATKWLSTIFSLFSEFLRYFSIIFEKTTFEKNLTFHFTVEEIFVRFPQTKNWVAHLLFAETSVVI